MSIRDQLQMALNAGWIVNVQPTLPGLPHLRAIFAVNRLWQEISDELEATDTAIRTGRLLADLDRFLSGQAITVGRRPRTNCFLKLLCPHDQEIWEIRSTDPRPSLRIFGRFVATDAFVATNKGPRTDYGAKGSVEFAAAITECQIEWRRAFSTWEPHSGAYPNDYISEKCIDLELNN